MNISDEWIELSSQLTHIHTHTHTDTDISHIYKYVVHESQPWEYMHKFRIASNEKIFVIVYKHIPFTSASTDI